MLALEGKDDISEIIHLQLATVINTFLNTEFTSILDYYKNNPIDFKSSNSRNSALLNS